MKIKIEYEDIDQYIKKWCKILDKYFPLSDKELDIVSYLIQKQMIYKSKGLDKELNELMLSTSMRKDICTDFNFKEKTLNTYISILRQKKVLINNLVNNRLFPSSELIFIFNEKKK